MLVIDITCIIYSRLMPSAGVGGRVGSVEARRAIDLKVRGWSPALGGSRIAG